MEPIIRPASEINPLVRIAGKLTILPEDAPPTRVAYDHRLFYITEQNADFLIRGTRVSLRHGDLLLLLSGTPYRIAPPNGGFSLLYVNFDFFGGERQNSLILPLHSIPMTTEEGYREELRVEPIVFREGLFPDGFACLPGCAELLPELLSLTREAERGELFCAGQIRAHFTLCLNRIFRRLLIPRPHRRETAHDDILSYLSTHYAEELTNRSVAERFHYHPNYVGQIILEATGLPLHQYLLHLRIRHAGELLLSSGMPIGDIARLTGFPDAAYFTQYFRRTVGCTPSEFRGRK